MSQARLQDLSPEQARTLSLLLDEGLRVAAADRARWHSELSQREPELWPLVSRLLSEMQVSSATTQDDSIVRAVSSTVRQSHGLEPGQQLGAYRLLRALGQGGMGSVWLAERADGLFQRQVALKLPHRHLVDTAAFERFARERDILARLSHPQIARLLDAGLSSDGHPFLALEYVEGRSLSVFCDEERLGLRARLALMQQVLEAVQYAHQSLVIHRDLKPNNILVTASSQVRLLDFGISKLMTDGHSGLSEDSELTQYAGRALTPDYAAPEQVAGLPVSTASDVYSLGVVLYSLLCGSRPFVTLEGRRRYALHKPELSTPLRPSQQALTEAIAGMRGTTAKRLQRALSGDLDTIVLKALQDDPRERYPTAEAFREDIARYLAGEPIKARPANWAYQAWKLVRRQRVAVSLSAAVVLLLLAATQFSLQQANQAQRAAELATQQAERARVIQDFLLGVFLSNSDQQRDPLEARTRTARELLDSGSQRIVSQLSATPDVLADLCETLADMYHQLGLGADAARLRKQRIAALQTVHGKDHELVAEALLLLAKDQRQAGENPAALATVAEARDMLDRMGDDSSQTRAFVWLAAAEIEQTTALAQMREDAARARAYFTAHTVERMWSNRFMSVELAARAEQLTGELDRAEAGYVAALHELEALGQHPSAWSVTPLVWLAETQWQAARFDAAEANLRQALALSQRFNGAENGSTLQTQTKLGALLHQSGKRADGLALLRDVEAKLGDAKSLAIATWRSMYGAVLLDEGRSEEAARLIDALIAELSLSQPESLPLARALLLKARAARLLGQHEEAAAASGEALRVMKLIGGAAIRPSVLAPYYNAQARAQLGQGDIAGAEETLSLIAFDDPESADAVETQLARAQSKLLEGRWGLAQREAQHALRLLRAPRLLGHLPLQEAEAMHVLGRADLELGEQEDGCVALQHATGLLTRYERSESLDPACSATLTAAQ